MKYLYIILLFFLTITYGCKKDSEGLTRITYFADLVLTGESTIVVPLGGSFVEPGYTATENGTDVTSNVVVTSNVDVNTTGLYTIVYSVDNSDGISKTVSRNVIVAVVDAAAPASGLYAANSVRTEADGSNPRPRSSEILVINEGSNVFSVSCLLGYYYAAGFGPDYAIKGKVQFNPADNTFSYIESYCVGWDDSLADFRNGSYNPATGELYWESIYAGNDTFAVTSTKN